MKMATHGEPLKIIPQMLTQCCLLSVKIYLEIIYFSPKHFATESPDTSVSAGGVRSMGRDGNDVHVFSPPPEAPLEVKPPM